MDGLLLRINSDFLNLLFANGFEVEKLRLRFFPRNASQVSSSFMTLDSKTAFEERFSAVLTSTQYLCSAGTFPVIQNIQLSSKSLPFQNQYKWFDIVDNPKLVTSIEENRFKEANFKMALERHQLFLEEQIKVYQTNTINSIKIRLESYVDPCYVDAGYVSPNGEIVSI